MSSDILSRDIDFGRFDMIWAGIQKNLGAAGVALAILKRSLLATARTDIPEFLQYQTFVKKDSAFNTPPVFCIYSLNRMLHWIKNRGGLPAIEERNKVKARLIYDVIDESDGFYKGHAEKEARSRMNVTFNLANARWRPTSQPRQKLMISSVSKAIDWSAASASLSTMPSRQRRQRLWLTL